MYSSMDENTEMPQIDSERDEQRQIEVNFRYIKSNLFRVVHIDGALGGVTPRGNIHISLYNERPAIPDGGKLTVSSTAGEIIKPEQYIGKGGIIREIEVDVMIDLPTAQQLKAWLERQIKALQEMVLDAQNEGISDAETKMARG